MIVGALIGLLVMSGVVLSLHLFVRTFLNTGFQPTGVTAIWFAFAMAVGAVLGA